MPANEAVQQEPRGTNENQLILQRGRLCLLLMTIFNVHPFPHCIGNLSDAVTFSEGSSVGRAVPSHQGSNGAVAPAVSSTISSSIAKMAKSAVPIVIDAFVGVDAAT